MASVSNRAEEVPWSGIRKMFNLAAQVPEAVNLSVGQPDFDTPGYIVEAAKRALDEGQTRYTPGLGILPLREAIARKVWRENRIQADPAKEIMVTVGAMEGIILSLLAIVDPGDEVIIGDPSYTNYQGQIQLVNGEPVKVPALESNDFRMDPNDIEKAITKKTKLLIINSPANPTGAVLLLLDLEAIAEIARRHDLFVLSDEAYERLVYDEVEHISIARLPGMRERTISVFTFSKTYAMTGWRMGYVVGPRKVIDQMHKMQEDLTSCIPGFIQQAGIVALDGPQDCVLEAHFHNDFGLAVANTLVALANGVEVAHASICGVGERSGAAALEDVAVALLTLYGIDLGLNYDKLCQLAQMTVELSGHRLPQNKSIVGDGLFAIESGIVAMWMARCTGPLATEVFPLHWELMGQNPPQVVLGKGAGKASILSWLERLGLEASEEEINRLLPLVKEEGMAKKRLLTEGEFRELVERVQRG